MRSYLKLKKSIMKLGIDKDKNSEDLPHLEITEVVLVHCKNVNNDYQHDSKVLYIFSLINPLVHD